MLKTWSRKLGLLVVLLMAVFTITVQRIGHAQKGVWTANNQSRQSFVKDKGVARTTFPTEFKLYDLNLDALHQQLFTIVGDTARGRSTTITLPNADGAIEEFEVFEDSNFEPDLQAQFPTQLMGQEAAGGFELPPAPIFVKPEHVADGFRFAVPLRTLQHLQSHDARIAAFRRSAPSRSGSRQLV